MRNCIVTVVGKKGSGKTTFAISLVDESPRVVIIDRMYEYENGIVCTSYDMVLDALSKYWRGDFRVICRLRSDMEYAMVFRFLTDAIQRCPTTPISLVVEEADFFASPQRIEPTLDYIYRYGRHYYINVLAVARGDTDLHRSMIQNADRIVMFQSHRFSSEMRERFTDEERATARKLKTAEWGTVPVEGVNYLEYGRGEGQPGVAEYWRAFQFSASHKVALKPLARAEAGR